MILTDAKGRPIDKPVREDYPTAQAYMEAVWAYNDKIANIANEAFTTAFRAAMKKPAV